MVIFRNSAFRNSLALASLIVCLAQMPAVAADAPTAGESSAKPADAVAPTPVQPNAVGAPDVPTADDESKRMMKAQMKIEMERQLLVGMYALRDYCKELQPDKAKAIDDSWAKSTADIPPQLVEFSKTPDFSRIVGDRKKMLSMNSKKEDAAAELAKACDKFTAQ